MYSLLSLILQYKFSMIQKQLPIYQFKITRDKNSYQNNTNHTTYNDHYP